MPGLRDVLLAEWPYVTSEIGIVDGSMDALDLVARTAICFGDRVAVEHPCFPPLLDLLDSIGADVVGVPLDSWGMEPASLAVALASPLAAVVLQPTAQNPSGVSTTAPRAHILAKLIEGADTLVIEDDSAGPSPRRRRSVSDAGSPNARSKSAACPSHMVPHLRLAAVSGPAQLVHDILALRQLGQGWSSRWWGPIMKRWLTSSPWPPTPPPGSDEDADRSVTS